MSDYLWCVMGVNPSDNKEFIWNMFYDGKKAEEHCKEMNEFTKNHVSREWFYCMGKEARDDPPEFFTKNQIIQAMNDIDWNTEDGILPDHDCEFKLILSNPNLKTIFELLLDKLGIKPDSHYDT